MEGGYSEPCVMLVATEVLPQLLASHGHAPHCFVATEPASRAAAEGLLGSWRAARRREFVAAGRRSGREVRESTVFRCAWRYFLLTAARQVGVVEPPAARLLGASAAPSSPARRAAGQEAALHYAAVDLRLSRGQCAACTADLAPTAGEEAAGAGGGWTMEAVAPRAFAPMRRAKRRRTGAADGAEREEMRSLRGGGTAPPAGMELWSAVPGAVLQHLGPAPRAQAAAETV